MAGRKQTLLAWDGTAQTQWWSGLGGTAAVKTMALAAGGTLQAATVPGVLSPYLGTITAGAAGGTCVVVASKPTPYWANVVRVRLEGWNNPGVTNMVDADLVSINSALTWYNSDGYYYVGGMKLLSQSGLVEKVTLRQTAGGDSVTTAPWVSFDSSGYPMSLEYAFSVGGNASYLRSIGNGVEVFAADYPSAGVQTVASGLRNLISHSLTLDVANTGDNNSWYLSHLSIEVME